MDLLIYCSGGLAREVIDLARRMNNQQHFWNEIAFLDLWRPEREYYGARVLRMEDLTSDQYTAVVANGEPLIRRKLRLELTEKNIALATLIDPSAVVSTTARLGAGCVIFPHCYISSLAQLGNNVTMVTGAAIGHDAIIGNDAMISGHVNVGGGVQVGEGTYIGMGSQVKESATIGRSTIIGMGSIVYSDIPEGVVALGNPCRPMQKNSDGKVFHSAAGLR